MLLNKKGYFQGGGGVNEPTPKKKKYKSDPAIVNQTRFKEPFYQNYDIYDIPGFEHIGPGAGWHSMQKYKSVSEFLKAKRKKMKDKYKADDSWILDDNSKTKKNPNIQARTALFEKIVKIASDENDGPNFDYGKGLYSNMDKYKSVKDFEERANKGPGAFFADDINDLDFPIDDQISTEFGGPFGETTVNHNPVGESNLTGGRLDEYLPEDDFEGKLPTALNFGRDYAEDEEIPDILDKLINKYLNPSETDLFGLPDGIDPNSDLDAEETTQSEQPYTGTSDIGTQIYDDKWNI